MKLLTITCHHVYNHGALLQAYALVEFLKGEGHDVSIIDYRPPYLDEHFKLWRSNARYNRMGLGWAYVLAKLPRRILALKRKRAFDVFFDRYMTVTNNVYRSVDDLRANPPQADLYIAGSDQIWNTTFCNGTDPSFYLDFGAPQRKISYAASFATGKLKKGTEDFVTEKLRNFDAISVREKSAVSLLKTLGYDGIQVVDPVFLLELDDWAKLEKDIELDCDYILTYDFELHDSEIGKIAKRLARLYNCKIFSIGPFKMRYADKSFVDYAPNTFLTLIKHAKFVISNSFHATAFSIIYKKDFFVVNRKDGLNNRMHDLLTHYNLSKRLIDSDARQEQLTKPIDYSVLAKQLSEDISASKSFLASQITLSAK